MRCCTSDLVSTSTTFPFTIQNSLILQGRQLLKVTTQTATHTALERNLELINMCWPCLSDLRVTSRFVAQAMASLYLSFWKRLDLFCFVVGPSPQWFFSVSRSHWISSTCSHTFFSTCSQPHLPNSWDWWLTSTKNPNKFSEHASWWAFPFLLCKRIREACEPKNLLNSLHFKSNLHKNTVKRYNLLRNRLAVFFLTWKN